MYSKKIKKMEMAVINYYHFHFLSFSKAEF